MKVYNSHEIKNIALLGNDGSGKTTLTEALLFESGLINVADVLRQKIRCRIISLLSKITVIPSSQRCFMWNGITKS